MGCVGTKPDQDSGGKTLSNNDMGNRNQAAHYVKDPTVGSKAVSGLLHQGFIGLSGNIREAYGKKKCFGDFLIILLLPKKLTIAH